ncbi:9390_t:CDS:2, partial [Acaulospora colombiana]
MSAEKTPAITSTTTPTSKPADNVSGSEYQSSYAWRLPMVQVNRPKERTVTEYQREFTWREPPTVSTPSPTPAIVNSNAPEVSSISRNASQSPVVVDRLADTTKTDIPPAIKTPDLKHLDLPPTPTPPPLVDVVSAKHNGGFVGEPEDSSNVEKFSTNHVSKWKDGLRKESVQEPSSLASSLDPRAKKLVALEASRLSKKSRSYSMYSLADQLKTMEIARDLSNPMESEYKQQFIDWQEYGRVEKEAHPEKGDSSKRRGSWSAPLPAPLKWLEGLDLDDPLSRESRKLKPTVTDANSIRAHPKRPTTSADFRDYGNLDSDYSSPPSTTKSNKQIDQDIYTVATPRTLHRAKSSIDLTRSKSLGGSPLRNSIVLNSRDDRDLVDDPSYPVDARRRDPDRDSRNRSTYIDERRRGYEHLYNDNRRDNAFDEKRRDNLYDERRKGNGYDERRRDDVYDERRRDDVYDERRRDDVYDERRRDDVYDGRRRDDVYDEKRRDNVYDEKRRDNVYDEKRRDNVYDEKRRDYAYDDKRHRDYDIYNEIRQRDNGFDARNSVQKQSSNSRRDHEDYESRYNGRSFKTSDQEQYGHYVDLPSGGGHTRNPSYASSSKSSIHDDGQPPTAHPSYLEHLRHRSSFSDISSVSTPSSPATPNSLYDGIEQRWRTSNGLDPRIYKEQMYASSVTSKASSGSPKSSWHLDDVKDRHYQPSVLSPSRNKLYMEDDEEDEYASQFDLHGKRHSQPYMSSRDRALKSSSSTPRSHNSTYSSPSYTRDPSPSRESHHRKHQQRMFSPTLSPSYSSRPESRASVSSHATSIEEESALLTDILRDAEGLTIKNLNSQLAMIKNRDFGLVAPGVEKKTQSTPSTRRTSVASGSKSSATRASSTKSTSSKTSSRTMTKATTPTAARTPAKGIKSNSVPGTPGAGSKSKAPNSKGTPSSKTRPTNSTSTTSSYREAYRDYTLDRRPTDFTAAREALNRAKLKVDEMLEM